MATNNNTALTVKFNAKPYVFKGKAALVAMVKKAADKNTPPDAKDKNLKHRIYLPGLKAPTSIGWTAQHLFNTSPVGVVAAGENKGGSKGAYHPAQLMAAADKLQPYGVKVESDAPSPRYAKWSKAARAALEQLNKSTKKSTATKKAAPKKSTKKKSTKKQAA